MLRRSLPVTKVKLSFTKAGLNGQIACIIRTEGGGVGGGGGLRTLENPGEGCKKSLGKSRREG